MRSEHVNHKNFRVPFLQRSDFTCFALRIGSAASQRTRSKKIVALKLCKQQQHVEESEVSWRRELIFHTLINTCVENLILQKYILSSSA
jgi:hypothetical protein